MSGCNWSACNLLPSGLSGTACGLYNGLLLTNVKIASLADYLWGGAEKITVFGWKLFSASACARVVSACKTRQNSGFLDSSRVMWVARASFTSAFCVALKVKKKFGCHQLIIKNIRRKTGRNRKPFDRMPFVASKKFLVNLVNFQHSQQKLFENVFWIYFN